MEKLYADILKSIALLEASTAEVLKAESEKIRHAISSGCDPSTLLEVNASVSCTIEDLMWLELVSYHKLKAILCGGSFGVKNDNCENFNAENYKNPCQNENCTGLKEKSPQKVGVDISGKVFNHEGVPLCCGVVTASGKSVVSTEICHDGSYFLKGLTSSDRIILNAHSELGKSGSFLLKKPFKDSYQIDMFLDG